MNRHDDRIAGLIALTGRLAEHIASENALLESRRPRELADRFAEKARLSAALGSEIVAFKSEPGLLAEADPVKLGVLKAETGKLREALAVHQRKLSAIKSVTEGIVRAIGTELARENRAVARYDENAVIGPVARNWTVARPTALAFNQTV